MDNYTVKASKILNKINEQDASEDLAKLSQIAKVATSIGATPEKSRIFQKSGQERINRALDRVFSKIASKIEELERKI
mgnify:FL=1